MMQKALLALFVFCVSGVALAAGQGAPPSKTFLIIHSYERDYTLTNDQDAGAVEAFQKQNMEAKGWRIERIYLDQKKKTPSDLESTVRQSKASFEKIKPDAVLITDDFAFKNFFPVAVSMNIPVVMSGVNADAETYGYKPGMANVSGTLERYNYPTTLQLLKKVRPGLKRLLLVNDDDITGNAIEKDFFKKVENDAVAKDTGFSYETYRGTSVDKLKKRLLSVDSKDTAVFLMTLYSQRDAQDKHVSQVEIDKWIRAKTSFVDVGLSFFQVQDGRLMSLAGSMRESGFYATSLIFRSINEGFNLSSVPIRTMLPLRLILNHERAKRLGVKFSYDILTYAEETDRWGR